MPDNDNHVFIVGLPRTGTSIMYRTIQKLPNFQSIKLNLMETKIFMKDIPFNTTDLYYPSLLGYFYHNREFYEEFLSSVKKYTNKLRGRRKNEDYSINMKSPKGAFNKFKIFSGNKLVELKWKPGCKNKIIKQFFTYAKKIRQSKRIVEKTPHHYKHVHQILWTFPNSRIIWMIRHPLDIITSSIKRSQSDEKYKNYWNTENFIEEFKGSFHRYDFYKRLFKGNIMLIKYEDFVNDPVNQLKQICSFLNETFSEDSLTLKNQEIPKWKPYSPFIFSNIVNKTDRNWKEYISMKDAKKIETALQYLMRKYNFNSYA
jgi:hypothetical protein